MSTSLTIRKKHAFTDHQGSVYALAPGLTRESIFSGSSDRFIASWNLATGTAEEFSAQLPAPVYSLLHLTDQQVLFAGNGAGSVHCITTAERREAKILQLHQAPIFDLAASRQHQLLFTAGGDGQFAVVDLKELQLLKIRKLCTEKVRNIALHSNQQVVAVACGDGMIRLFHLPEVTEIDCFVAHRSSVNCVSWSPDGKLLLSGGKDAHLNVWAYENAFTLLESIPAHNYAIYSIVWSPDGTYFSTGSRDKTVKIWDPASRNVLARINRERYNGHHNSVNKLLWSDYNDLLISTGDDRTILTWEIQDVGYTALKELGLR
jgi:WD40 repeat protein